MTSTPETTALIEGGADTIEAAAAILKAAGIDFSIGVANAGDPGS